MKVPRFIRDEKFFLLVESIKSFPQMLDARGIVVENGEIIGGKTESCFLLAPNGRESNAPKPAQAGAKKEQALADLLLT